MSVPLWAWELVQEFWAEVGQEPAFPRDLRPFVETTFPVSCVELPGLSVARVQHWLGQRKGGCGFAGADRLLRGCLFAERGVGLVFLDRDDEPAEQRFTLAHEMGHYLRDYWQPRRDAIARLGPGILDVFDGLRPARPEERLHALLRRVAVGPHVHLLDRNRAGALSATVAEAEANADLLAFELLAPAAVVQPRLEEVPDMPEAVAALLEADFGLPPGPAVGYARMLLPGGAESEPWIVRLGEVVKKMSHFGGEGGM